MGTNTVQVILKEKVKKSVSELVTSHHKRKTLKYTFQCSQLVTESLK